MKVLSSIKRLIPVEPRFGTAIKLPSNCHQRSQIHAKAGKRIQDTMKVNLLIDFVLVRFRFLALGGIWITNRQLCSASVQRCQRTSSPCTARVPRSDSSIATTEKTAVILLKRSPSAHSGSGGFELSLMLHDDRISASPWPSRCRTD
jgi:hypothetical protein